MGISVADSRTHIRMLHEMSRAKTINAPHLVRADSDVLISSLTTPRFSAHAHYCLATRRAAVPNEPDLPRVKLWTLS